MRTRLFLALTAAIAPAAALAQTVPPPPPPGHEHLQVFIAPCGRPYRVPGDQPYPVATWFAEADGNHDGRLTETEMSADALRFFAELDIDHDGLLEPSEVDRYETVVAPEVRSSSAWGDGAAHGGHHGGGHGGHRRGGGGGMGGGGMGGGMGGGGMDGDGMGGTSYLRPASYVAGEAGEQDEGGGGDESPSAPFRAIGSFHGAMNGAARFSLLAKPEPVTAANVNMRIDIRPADFTAMAEEDFATLDTAHKGYLLLSDLPQTPAQAHRFGGRR